MSNDDGVAASTDHGGVHANPRPATNKWALVAVFTVAAVLRLGVLWLPNSDDDIFLQDWATRAYEHGVASVYDPSLGSVSAMHPPLNYYLLWLSGAADAAWRAAPLDGSELTSVPLMVLVKLPNLLVDLAIAGVIFLAARRRLAPIAALGVVSFYLFNPAIVWEAGFVGQVEAVQTLPIIAAVLLLVEGRVEAAWVAMALAALTKPQGLVLGPLVLWFSVLSFSGGRLVRAAAAAAAAAGIVLVPWVWAGRLVDVQQVYEKTVDTYPFLTLNAANLWSLVSAGMNSTFGIGAGDGSNTVLIPDAGVFRGIPWLTLTYKQLGLGLFGLTYAVALWVVARQRDAETFVLGAAFVFLAFFLLPTQITERYLFPSIVLLALALVYRNRQVLCIYVIASVTFMVNLYLVFPLVRVWPWNVASNAKEPLPYQFYDIPLVYRRSLTMALALVNLTLLVWFATVLVRQSSRGGDRAGRREEAQSRSSAA